MGFREMFYPDRKRDLRPKYRNHCSCNECIDRNKTYGDMWRHKTPVCTCCDCMAIAGQDIPHSYSTYEHTHAPTHTCAMTGPVRHSPYPGSTPCGPPACREEPPPKYSLKPHTTHKVDDACGARVYATPLFPEKNNPHNYRANDPYFRQCGQSSSTSCCSSSSSTCRSYRDDMYVCMPGSYRPCNR
ncbi:hypothetical protein GGI23_002409 [Coemansia sp. RSA 2559]|nr:hypothetical protein GGI23_002409 [Coemansia sp. RSA 2559]